MDFEGCSPTDAIILLEIDNLAVFRQVIVVSENGPDKCLCGCRLQYVEGVQTGREELRDVEG